MIDVDGCVVVMMFGFLLVSSFVLVLLLLGNRIGLGFKRLFIDVMGVIVCLVMLF